MLMRVFAPGHGLSQLVTSFFASESQGILHVPFSPFLLLRKLPFSRLPVCRSLHGGADGLSARPVEILQLNCLKELSVMIFALFARDT